MSRTLFITPLDALSPRGHHTYGAAGSFGEASMPPAPSVFAGALRSALLAQDPATLAAFERRQIPDTPLARAVVDFRLDTCALARQHADGRIETLHPLPADLVAQDDGLHALTPRPRPAGVRAGDGLPFWPVLRAPRGKPLGGRWLSAAGLAAHLAGHLPEATQLVASGALWKSDPRLGIALDPDKRNASDGALFTAEHVALADGVGFLVASSCLEALAGNAGLLRLAGDGRGARWQRIDTDAAPVAPVEAIAHSRRCRLILASPGLFAAGWLPPGVDPATRRLEGDGFAARLACAAMPRAGLVSGWDLFNNEPKPALRAVPVGSVWWFDEFAGDAGKLAEWVAGGLWRDNDGIDESRRAEGWNRAWLGVWN